MALLDWISDPGPVIGGDRVSLRPPRAGDYAAWAKLRADSEAYLRPWEPTWPKDDLTRASFKRRLSIYAREVEAGNAFPFFVFTDRGRTLVGAITVSNIRRGVADTATLGYWIGQPFAGKGYATAAVKAISRHAYDGLELHRLEAACVPDNAASRRVLEKSGFELEGRAKAYLKINGVWADHLLFGRINDRA